MGVCLLQINQRWIIVLILVCVEVSVGDQPNDGCTNLSYVLILVCVEVSVGDKYNNYINIVDIMS